VSAAKFKITLKPDRDKSIINRHPWIFSGGIASKDEHIADGDLVKIYSNNDQFLAIGYYNSRTSIAVRILTFTDEPIDEIFWTKRFKNAFELRKEILKDQNTNACRLVHSEGDLIPGLVIDRYNDYLVVQVSTLGIDKLKNEIVSVLQTMLKPKGIFENSDSPSRKMEGLKPINQVLTGDIPEIVEVLENGVKFKVAMQSGQKTGFFLDQRDNRQLLKNWVKDLTVLNCFSYTGGFSAYAALAGAKQITSLDISEPAMNLAQTNIKLNDLDLKNHEFIVADAFEKIREMAESGRQFDFVILDPPAFVKDSTKVMQGARGYKDINRVALKLVPVGGYLMTCSCSHFIDRKLFQKIVHDAAIDAGRTLRILEIRGAGADHPININHPEGEYLKVLLCQVVE
jgi:23S rRNA (cytosine1962-C5)-methyltransferase